MFKSRLLFLLIAMVCLIGARSAWAVPTLQLYTPDGTYVSSGVYNGVNVVTGQVVQNNSFSLVVAGATTPGWVTTIDNVQLWVAIQQADYLAHPLGTITLKDSANHVIAPLGPAVYGNPGLPVHGIYDAYYVGFDLPDLMAGTAGDNVYNYQDFNPSKPGADDSGDLQNFTVSFTGFNYLHLDLSGTALGGNHSNDIVAPLSNDIDVFPSVSVVSPNIVSIDGPAVPEPLTSSLGAMGLAAMTLAFWRRR